MNIHNGEIVRRTLQSNNKQRVRFCDNQATLLWINNQDKPVKQWSCRNKQIYATFKMNVCARQITVLGIQHVNNLELVNQDSTWIDGFSWMKKEK